MALLQALGDKPNLPSVMMHLGSIAAYEGDVERSERLLDEALALSQALGEPGMLAMTYRFKGRVAYHLADWARARAAYQASLRLQRDVGRKWEIAACLEGLAGVADGQDESARAARLWGAAEGLREQMGAPVPPVDRVHYEAAVAHTRMALGEAGFGAAWAEGRAMTLEQVIAYALETAP